jgi:hypothetical protein
MPSTARSAVTWTAAGSPVTVWVMTAACRGRDLPGRAGGGGGREDRRQRLPGQGAAGAEVGGGAEAGGGLAGVQAQQLPQQHRRRLAAPLVGQLPGLDFGDRGVLDGGQPPLLGLQFAQQPEHLLVAAGGQVQGVQLVHGVAEQGHRGLRRHRPGRCEHTGEYTGSGRRNQPFGLISQGNSRKPTTAKTQNATACQRRKGDRQPNPSSLRLSPFAFRRSPFAVRRSPFAFRFRLTLSPFAVRPSSFTDLNAQRDTPATPRTG